MGEGGLRSLPPTRDERPAARPPSPLPLRGLRLPAAPLMSQGQESPSGQSGDSSVIVIKEESVDGSLAWVNVQQED